MENPQKIIVLGAGSFGTSLGHHLAGRGHDVTIWGRDHQVTQDISQNHKNSKYLDSIPLHKELFATSDLASLDFRNASAILLAIPTQHLRSVLSLCKKELQHTSPLIISAIKGIENKTLAFPKDIIASELGGNILKDYVSLSGPSFAIEVLKGLPTCVSLASKNPDASLKAQKIFHAPHFRSYTSHDPIGLELAGALKNVIAIASGACDGLGFESNSQAALITRGLSEMTRLGVSLGANPLTFTGLGGVGDLFLTSTSLKSRNYRAGFQLAKGDTLPNIIKAMGSVAEGITTSLSAYELSKKQSLDLPILHAVYEVVHDSKPIKEAVTQLLSRDAKPELTL